MSYNYLPNPGRAHISGSEERLYTFEPGDTLYHFNLSGKGHIVMNGMLMADDENHVREILQGYVDFVDECLELYKSSYMGSRHGHLKNALKGKMDYEYVVGDRKEKRQGRLTMIIQKAPLNQMFKTSWASNDCL